MALAIFYFSYIGFINKTFQSITPVSTDKYIYLVKVYLFSEKSRCPITPNGIVSVFVRAFNYGLKTALNPFCSVFIHQGEKIMRV